MSDKFGWISNFFDGGSKKDVAGVGEGSDRTLNSDSELESKFHDFFMKKDYYMSDTPISVPEQDRFNRWPFANRVAATISSRLDPGSIVIAIYGAWGEGKTSVLNLIERELKKSGDIIAIRFNPWRFNDEAHLLQNFFKTLADAIGKSPNSYKEKIGRLILNYAAILMPFSFSVPFFEITPGESVKSLGKIMSSVELDELRKRIEKFLKDENKRVVVIMDDIDRLDRAEIQNIFKLVKLSADFDNTAYILAFDEDMVSSALGERYGSGNKESGRNFLEKIVQVPLNLPMADKLSLRKFFFDCVDEVLKESAVELTDEESQAFVINYIYGLEPRLATPRIAKCYRNVLSFSLPILKKRVNHLDLMLVEALRVFYPALYDIIRANPDVFLGTQLVNYIEGEDPIKVRNSKIIERGFTGLLAEEIEAAKYILKYLFPRTMIIFGSGSYYGAEWNETWNNELRVASEEHFSKYFSYSISDNDISNAEIKKFIELVENNCVNDICDEIKKITANKGAEKFLLAVMRKERNLTPAGVKKLAAAISKSSDIFPKPVSSFTFTSVYSQAGIFVSQLVMCLKKGSECLKLAVEIMKSSSNLSFALECFGWIMRSCGSNSQNRIFSYEDEYLIAGELTSRLKNSSVSVPFYVTDSEMAAEIFNFWGLFGAAEDILQYIKDSFDCNVSNVVVFLKCFVKRSMLSDNTKPAVFSKNIFTDAEYQKIAKYIDPKLVYDAVCKLFGEELKLLETEKNQISLDEIIVYQFFRIYKNRSVN